MAKIEDLIVEIADARLRGEIAREVAALKRQKKFGLVFEEHIPEQLQLPGLSVKPGLRVVRRDGDSRAVFLVEEVHGNGRAAIRTENGAAETETVRTKDLVVIKRFGEPIYPTLTPIASLTRSPDRPYHAIVNADNFHALQLFLYCYAGQVDMIYIDPPYNTGARDWRYNNDYVDNADQWRHSKWLSMMKKRLLLAKRLLRPDGVVVVTIDEHEVFNLGLLLTDIFPDYEKQTVTIVMNPGGTFGTNLSSIHEYAIFCIPAGTDAVRGRPLSTAEAEAYNRTDDQGAYALSRLRKRGVESLRRDRVRMFYAVYLDPATLKPIDVGPEMALDEKPNLSLRGGRVPVYPIDEKGIERRWSCSRETMLEWMSAGQVIAERDRKGVLKLYRKDRLKTVRRLNTVWTESEYSAGDYGSRIVNQVLGRANAFPFPKSVYAVRDTIGSVCRTRTNALIVDFFAGSGTTYHATAMLNAEDGGNRRCLLVTNNEVTEKLAKQLNLDGLFPGDVDFEKHGICEAVTWTRCKFVTQGHRDDGTPLPGSYLDGGNLKDGYQENIEYFRLDFLDPHEVAYGDRFEAIIPILWLTAGARGERETVRGRGKWFIPKNSPYAVLLQEQYFAEFKREIAGRPDIVLVFLVTDSEEAFREMSAALPGRPQTKMLYKSYLDNFRINLEKTL